VLVCLDGVPGASGANRIENGSSLDLGEMLKQLVSGVTAPARFWPQVRSRRSGQEGRRSGSGRAGQERRYEEMSVPAKTYMQRGDRRSGIGQEVLGLQERTLARRCMSAEALMVRRSGSALWDAKAEATGLS